MIGRVLSNEFFENRDWPVASAVAIVMLLLLLVPIVIFQRYRSRELASARMSARPRDAAADGARPRASRSCICRSSR